MLFPLYYCPGRSAGAGSPGDRDPVSKGIHPATPHPGRWLHHGTHLPFLFYAYPNPLIPARPKRFGKSAPICIRSNSLGAPHFGRPALRSRAEGAVSASTPQDLLHSGRSLTSTRRKPFHSGGSPRFDSARAFAFRWEPPHSCGGGALQHSEECAVFTDAL
jgi:hypothetical protein